MLTAEGLGKRFEGRWIFRGINFELQKGQALVVLGRNGSGKSTLLKVLSGLIAPTEGKVVRPVEIATDFGYFALDAQLYPALTIAEHFELAASLRGIPADTDLWLSRIGLEEARDRPGSKLSTGMRSRVKLALAVQASPSVLLLDEPAAGLDEAGKALVAEICQEQKQRGLLVMATNDPFERQFATHELEISPPSVLTQEKLREGAGGGRSPS